MPTSQNGERKGHLDNSSNLCFTHMQLGTEQTPKRLNSTYHSTWGLSVAMDVQEKNTLRGLVFQNANMKGIRYHSYKLGVFTG